MRQKRLMPTSINSGQEPRFFQATSFTNCGPERTKLRKRVNRTSPETYGSLARRWNDSTEKRNFGPAPAECQEPTDKGQLAARNTDSPRLSLAFLRRLLKRTPRRSPNGNVSQQRRNCVADRGVPGNALDSILAHFYRGFNVPSASVRCCCCIRRALVDFRPAVVRLAKRGQ